MALRIDPSHNRFRDIVRGKIKQNLRKYISNGEWLGRKGKDVISIPVPQIEMPRFRFGEQGQGGVGQGPGKVGDSLGPAATVSSSRRPALVAGPESRRGRGSRRLRSGIPATIVPVYSRIIYRASVVSVR